MPDSKGRPQFSGRQPKRPLMSGEPSPTAPSHEVSARLNESFNAEASAFLDRVMPLPLALACMSAIVAADHRLFAIIGSGVLIGGQLVLNQWFARSRGSADLSTDRFAAVRLGIALVSLPVILLASPGLLGWLPVLPSLMAIPFLASHRPALVAGTIVIAEAVGVHILMDTDAEQAVTIGLGLMLILWVVAPLVEAMRDRDRSLHVLQHRLQDALDEAERANNAKDAFLAHMSHEVRTPLNGIIGGLSLIRSTPDLAERDLLLNQASDCADGLLDLLNDVLDLTRLQAGRMPFQAGPTHIDKVLQQVRSVFESAARSKGLTLQVSRSPEIPDVGTSDSLRLRQVVFNLVGNAIKYTDTGRVEISVSPSGADRIVVVVRDTGTGIPESKLETIFDAFEQLGASTNGSGLGLALVKRLAEGLGGTVRAESTLGFGSTFSVHIPWIPAIAEPVPAAEPSVEVAGLRVLVVEDNPVNQVLTERMLAHLGCTSTIVETGEQGVEVGVSAAWDVVLMDVHLPGIDGLEATRQLRAEGCTTPIIALTASDGPETRAACAAAGMQGLQSKPLKLADLAARLAEVRSGGHPRSHSAS